MADHAEVPLPHAAVEIEVVHVQDLVGQTLQSLVLPEKLVPAVPGQS